MQPRGGGGRGPGEWGLGGRLVGHSGQPAPGASRLPRPDPGPRDLTDIGTSAGGLGSRSKEKAGFPKPQCFLFPNHPACASDRPGKDTRCLLEPSEGGSSRAEVGVLGGHLPLQSRSS